MFQFPRSPLPTASPCGDLVGSKPALPGLGCPIRESAGKFTSNKPQLIAASRALHRLLTPRHPPCALVSFFHVKSAKLKYTFYSVLKVLAPLAFTASPWPAPSDRGQRSTGKQKGSVHQPSPTTWQIPFSRVFSSSIRLPAYSPSTGPSKRRSWWSGGDSNPGCSSVQRRCHPTRRPPLARPWWPSALWWAFLARTRDLPDSSGRSTPASPQRPTALWWAFLDSNQRPQSYQDCALNQLS
jgi:hypothetical protein